MTEQELIQQAQNGTTDCFTQLVVLYQPRLYSYLLARCHNRHDADDVLQDTFINAYKYLKSYDAQWAFSTWLFTIANRQLHKISQSKAKHVQIAALENTTPSPEHNHFPDENNLWLLVKKHLDSASHDLLWFFYIEDMRIKDIAHVMKKSESWVKTTLHRSRIKLSNNPAFQQFKAGVIL
ncbi:RNA polymerase sigma factor [Marinicella rhabdoformis]|uniref:RNA polymerase sigma factor n=1 Tax=Marinicella rhabdoformis TaxID=2580566 RepID=UPI0012AEC80B|nr:sigma-70 family RNA polymerase sigma factor [Marinicella rhabdoformis]